VTAGGAASVPRGAAQAQPPPPPQSETRRQVQQRCRAVRAAPGGSHPSPLPSRLLVRSETPVRAPQSLRLPTAWPSTLQPQSRLPWAPHPSRPPHQTPARATMTATLDFPPGAARSRSCEPGKSYLRPHRQRWQRWWLLARG
jgi:hypothetical protein